AIPHSFQTELFDPGILLYIIVATGILMTFGLILNSISKELDPAVDTVTPTTSIDPSM
ncbi:unnamed protein product, partial [Chrysoparadoxa australica]